MKIHTMLAAACAAAALAATGSDNAPGYAIAYHGKLVAEAPRRISTKVPMTVEFRLYQNAEPGETAPLWGRSVPVRFDKDGLFYVELSDSNGASVERALCARLADAVVRAGSAGAWISVTPAGCGELLPRRPLGAVHRAERAAAVPKADRVEAETLEAETLKVSTCAVSGSFKVAKSFASGGGRIESTVDGTKSVSIGAQSGSVLFSDTVNPFWNEFEHLSKNTSHLTPDTLICYPKSDRYGAFSLPLPGGSVDPLYNDATPFLWQPFIYGDYNPYY